MTKEAEPLTIEVWSDIMCPFCFLGDELLTRALASDPRGERTIVRYRSYQLMPQLPEERAVDLIDLLVREKGIPRERALAMNAGLEARGAEFGLSFHFDRVKAVNTRRAHRLSHFAAQQGAGGALMRRLFEGYFTEGLNLGSPAVLAQLAEEAGLDGAAATEVVVSDAFDHAVSADQRRAAELGISGVPFFLLGGQLAISGAQPLEVFQRALQRAWG